MLENLLRLIPAYVGPDHIDVFLYEMGSGNYPIEIRPAIPVDIAVHTVANPSGDERIDSLLKRRRGSRCYIARHNGETVHESWLVMRVRVPRLFGFDGRAPCIGYCGTELQFRGKGIYPFVLSRIATDVFRECIYPKVYMLVSVDNIPSIRAIEKTGFRRVARLKGTRVGHWVFRGEVPASVEFENS